MVDEAISSDDFIPSSMGKVLSMQRYGSTGPLEFAQAVDLDLKRQFGEDIDFEIRIDRYCDDIRFVRQGAVLEFEMLEEKTMPIDRWICADSDIVRCIKLSSQIFIRN